jgi:hypothetical protein
VTELARWLVVATLASAASVAFAQEVNVVCGVPITLFIGRYGMISRKQCCPVSKGQVDREIKALL